MKKYNIIFLILLTGFTLIFSDLSGQNSLKNSLTVGLIKPFYGRLNVNYCHNFESASVYFGINYTYRQHFEDWDSYIEKVNGIAFDVMYRFHLNSTNKYWFKTFIGPAIKYQNLNKTYRGKNEVWLEKKFDIFSTGWIYGLEMIFLKTVCVDMYAGPVVKLSFFEHIPGTVRTSKWSMLEYQGGFIIANLAIGLKF